MIFGPCSRRACVSIPIDDDEQLELTKTYTYRLEGAYDLDRRIIIHTAYGTLTVIDDPTDGIRASVYTLYRDGTGEIPCTKRLKSRRE